MFAYVYTLSYVQDGCSSKAARPLPLQLRGGILYMHVYCGITQQMQWKLT